MTLASISWRAKKIYFYPFSEAVELMIEAVEEGFAKSALAGEGKGGKGGEGGRKGYIR